MPLFSSDSSQLRKAAESNNLEEVSRLLGKKGLNPNAPSSKDGSTPLHLAARNGHVDVVVALLAVGVDQDSRSQAGDTPLHCAAINGHAEVITKLLATGASRDAQNDAGRTAVSLASERGHFEAVMALLLDGADRDLPDQDGARALHHAAREGRVEVVKVLLSMGADAHTVDKNGASPLHVAAWSGHLSVVSALLAGPGAQVDATDQDGCTPLHHAALRGQAAVVQALLEAGAGKDATNTRQAEATPRPAKGRRSSSASFCPQIGWTPLHAACRNGHVEVVEALLAAGANTHILDQDSDTPLSLAERSGHAAAAAVLQGSAGTSAADKAPAAQPASASTEEAGPDTAPHAST